MYKACIRPVYLMYEACKDLMAPYMGLQQAAQTNMTRSCKFDSWLMHQNHRWADQIWQTWTSQPEKRFANNVFPRLTIKQLDHSSIQASAPNHSMVGRNPFGNAQNIQQIFSSQPLVDFFDLPQGSFSSVAVHERHPHQNNSIQFRTKPKPRGIS